MQNQYTKFYIENLAIESFANSENLFLVKQAQSISAKSIGESMVSSVSSIVKPGDQSSVLSALKEGVFSAGGLVFDGLVKILNFFGFNLKGILESMKNKLQNLFSSKDKVSPDEVDAIVYSSINSNKGEDISNPSSEQASFLDKFLPTLSVFASSEDINDTIKVYSEKLQKDFKIVYAAYQLKLAASITVVRTLIGILYPILTWFLKKILWIGGFLLLGSAIVSAITPHATKEVPSNIFKVNPTYSEENLNTATGLWRMQANLSELPDILEDWATEIYPELKGHENIIKSNPAFQNTVNEIKKYTGTDSNGVIGFPGSYHSRKDVVNEFVSEIAKNFHEPKNK